MLMGWDSKTCAMYRFLEGLHKVYIGNKDLIEIFNIK